MKLINHNWFNYQKLWICLIIVIGIYRFSLTDRGALVFPDELSYVETFNALHNLFKDDLKGFCKHISSIGAIPGNTTIRMIPAIGQLFLCKLTGVPVFNPYSLKVATAFNVIISLFILIVFYKLSFLLFNKDPKTAFLSMFIYGLVVNNNIYIRHIVPYDISLLCFLSSLYIIVKSSITNYQLKTYIISGILVGFGFAIYQGYYFFPVLIFTLILFNKNLPIFSNQKLIGILIFVISAVTVLLFYEILAKIGDVSLFNTYLLLGQKDFSLGDFNEGFIFIFKYLFEVEGVMGILIIAFSLLCYAKIFLHFSKAKTSHNNYFVLKMLLMISLTGYLIHASLSYFFHSKVFFGRLLHMYYPFLIWAIFIILSDIRNKKLKYWMTTFTIVISLYSFVIFSIKYYSLGYPRDILYKKGIKIENVNYTNIIHETPPYVVFASPDPWNAKTGKPYMDNKNYKLVNFCFLIHNMKDLVPYKQKDNEKLIFSRPHFNTFPAYYYEGHTPQERAWLKERQYKISVYEIVN